MKQFYILIKISDLAFIFSKKIILPNYPINPFLVQSLRKKFHPNVFHAFPKSICLKEAVRWIALLPATIPAAYTRK